jgi:Tol biopolymer transport system component
MMPGTKLGPYEILSAIGAGGMGEVYRARDPKLGRDVAIKVLPEAFARDAERMARFQREAKVLASLNHPNIATIYGLEDSGSTRALVMELVEGPTLADRIKAGPIPIDEALPIARQICDALEYAHERGIIHRDLKPANVKVARDDTVKILDFGLAKALEEDAAPLDISTSPTLSRLATMQGVLLGTAAYMSPEQAKGKQVDRRADIWAFGCVLYEMLTGKMAFHGEAVTDTLAAVIKEEPDWSLLPASTPPHVRVLLRRCLQKDARQRLRDIGDARVALDEVLTGSVPAPAVAAPAWRRALPWALFGTTAVALTLVTWALWRTTMTGTPADPMRFQIPLPDKITLSSTGAFAASPDGRQLAFAAFGPDAVEHLWVRSLDSLEARPLPGSEAAGIRPFFWSPDSRYIAFDAGGKLKKIPLSGGPAETICDLTGLAVGGSWNRDGVIIFGTTNPGGVMRVPAGGGAAIPLTKLDPARHETRHVLPWFLPDGRHFIYKRESSEPGNSGVYVGSLDAKPENQSSTALLATQYGALYVPSADVDVGQIVFVRDQTLLAQPFNARRLEFTGDAVTLADGVGTFIDFGLFSASSNGELIYRVGSNRRGNILTWYDRQGKVLRTAGEPGSLYSSADLSPDGDRAAVSRYAAEAEAGVAGLPWAIWLVDFSRGTSTRFTFGSASAGSPIWSPDGSRIIFASNRDGNYNLYEKPASGAGDEVLLLKSSEDKYPNSWSRDARFLLYTTNDPKTRRASLWIMPLEGDKKPFPFFRSEFNEGFGRFSPDGQWVAYASDESGRNEIYVRPFSPSSGESVSTTAGKWLISNNGGQVPRWRQDGKELYYLAPDGRLMAVEISLSPAFRAGVPKPLFQTPVFLTSLVSQWAVSQWDSVDGKRFLFLAPATESEQAPFTVVLNWQAALKK